MLPFNHVSKREFLFGLAILVVVGCISCLDDNQTRTCSDPLGSQNITINNNLTDYNNCFFCFKGKTITNADTCLYNYCFYLYSSSNPQIIWSTYFKGCQYGTIMDVGEVSCLGEVDHKPTSGFDYSVKPMLHHGYVVHFPDNSYGRFFIDSWKMTGSEITIMNIVRQYPF